MPFTEFERRLWFDYLAKVHDRERQSSQVSGATTWALLVVLGTALLKIVSISTSSNPSVDVVGAIFTTTTVALVAIIWWTVATWFVVLYATANEGLRITPEQRRRANAVMSGLVSVVCWYLTIALTWVGVYREEMHGWTLLPYLLVLSCLITATLYDLKQRYTRLKNLFGAGQVDPSFDFTFPPRFAMLCAICVAPVAASASYVAVRCIRTLVATRADWQLILELTAYVVVSVILFITIAGRLIAAQKQSLYADFELALVQGTMEPAEFQQKLSDQLFGQTLESWLEELRNRLGFLAEEIQGSLQLSLQQLAELQREDQSPHGRHWASDAAEFTQRRRQKLQQATEVLNSIHVHLSKLEPAFLSRRLRDRYEGELIELSMTLIAVRPVVQQLVDMARSASELIGESCGDATDAVTAYERSHAAIHQGLEKLAKFRQQQNKH